MKNNKDNLRKYWLLGMSGALLIFFWGLISWMTARQYAPVTPKPVPLNRYSLAKKSAGHPIAKYQDLLSGKLFFGEGIMSNNQGAFQSRLVLWGLIHGSRAIVGADPRSNQNTWIVRNGDTVEEEKIVAIGENYITVRNRTGEGKVFLNQ